MGRSLKKGPFTDDHLVIKVAAMNAKNEKKVITHLVAALDDSAGVHRPYDRGAQRQEVHSGVRHREHGGPQAGRILADPHVQGPLGEGGDREVGEAVLRRHGAMEARAEARYIRVSPQKARLVVDLIRGRRRATAITISADHQQADRADGREGAAVGDRQRENKSDDVDVDQLIVSRSLRQRRAAHEAHPAGADGPRLPLSAPHRRTSS